MLSQRNWTLVILMTNVSVSETMHQSALVSVLTDSSVSKTAHQSASVSMLTKWLSQHGFGSVSAAEHQSASVSMLTDGSVSTELSGGYLMYISLVAGAPKTPACSLRYCKSQGIVHSSKCPIHPVRFNQRSTLAHSSAATIWFLS